MKRKQTIEKTKENAISNRIIPIEIIDGIIRDEFIKTLVAYQDFVCFHSCCKLLYSHLHNKESSITDIYGDYTEDAVKYGIQNASNLLASTQNAYYWRTLRCFFVVKIIIKFNKYLVRVMQSDAPRIMSSDLDPLLIDYQIMYDLISQLFDCPSFKCIPSKVSAVLTIISTYIHHKYGWHLFLLPKDSGESRIYDNFLSIAGKPDNYKICIEPIRCDFMMSLDTMYSLIR